MRRLAAAIAISSAITVVGGCGGRTTDDNTSGSTTTAETTAADLTVPQATHPAIPWGSTWQLVSMELGGHETVLDGTDHWTVSLEFGSTARRLSFDNGCNSGTATVADGRVAGNQLSVGEWEFTAQLCGDGRDELLLDFLSVTGGDITIIDSEGRLLIEKAGTGRVSLAPTS